MKYETEFNLGESLVTIQKDAVRHFTVDRIDVRDIKGTVEITYSPVNAPAGAFKQQDCARTIDDLIRRLDSRNEGR